MPKPSKIPILDAYSTLNDDDERRGYQHEPPEVLMEELEDIAVDDGHLVPVAKLKKFFANIRSFQDFKSRIYISDVSWNRVIMECPSLTNYARRFIASPAFRPPRIRPLAVRRSRTGLRVARGGGGRRGRGRTSRGRARSTSPSRPPRGRPRTKRGVVRVVSRLGEFSEDEISDADSDASVLSIVPSNDECDDTDVNLPLPTCQAFNRICRNYDAQRRYIPYQPDSSDDKRYKFKVSYV